MENQKYFNTKLNSKEETGKEIQNTKKIDFKFFMGCRMGLGVKDIKEPYNISIF